MAEIGTYTNEPKDQTRQERTTKENKNGRKENFWKLLIEVGKSYLPHSAKQGLVLGSPLAAHSCLKSAKLQQ